MDTLFSKNSSVKHSLVPQWCLMRCVLLSAHVVNQNLSKACSRRLELHRKSGAVAKVEKSSSAVAKRLLDAPCHLKIMLIQILVCMVVRNARFLCDSRAFCQSYKRVRQMSCRRLCVYPLIQRQSVEGVVNCSITLYIV